jgi:CHAT domain-containing protein
MNPNEARQNAYLQLVQALLTCPPHLEQQLLELNSEFVDMGLVMTLLAVAQRMVEQNDRQSILMSEWLVDFAQQLAQKLGMDMGESPAEDDEEYATFVLNLLQTVNDSDGDEAKVNAFLEEHLTYLNEHLLAIFPQQIDGLFALKPEPEWKLMIASTIHNLAVDLGEFTSGNRSINLELAIICYHRALSVYTQSDFPEQWAMMQNNLANIYRERIEGDRMANLELAIQVYQSALEVCTPRKYPIGQSPRFCAGRRFANANESGRIQASLEATIDLRNTLAQRDRHHPDIFSIEILTPSPNPEYAEFFLDLLQTVYDSQGNGEIVHEFFDDRLSYLDEKLLANLPQQVEILLAREDESDWKSSIASKLNSLAVNLWKFTRGNRSINLELAIACCELALEVYTRKGYPEQWATTQINLALAYRSRIRGERVANLEQSIACYELALEVRTRAAHPEDWATTQMNLAVAYWSRIRGERAANLEQSIVCYKLALEVYTRKAYPEDWAMTQMNLALAYWSRIRGERAANLELSIECYRLAVAIRTRAAYPEQWARTQMNLAGAYQSRIRGERAANLELSIDCYRLALEVYTRAAYPEDWATTQMNLAVAYQNRIRGERAANLELSIECYRLALEVRTRQAYPEQWATTQMNLALAYWRRIRGERAVNLELSIECYELALEVRTRQAYPEGWAMTQMNLALAYGDRIRGERAADLELSIACYELALEVFTPSAYPEQWANTQMNLAVTYRNRIRGERAANLELSIECSRLALEVYTPSAYPEDWAMTQNNLAVTYRNRIRGEQAANLELSIECSRLALEVYTPSAYPEQCLKTASNLGNLHYEIGNWQPAIHAYETAMLAVETSRSWVLNEESRQELLKDALSIYKNAIQCAINLQNYREAIQFTERIRSRNLVELMESKDLYADAQLPPEIATYLAEYQDINHQIQSVRQQPDFLGNKVTEITTLEGRKAEVYHKLRELDPVLVGQIQVETIKYTAIQQLITTPHTAILTCYTIDDHTHIFIIKQSGAPTIHTCKSQDSEQLQQLLQTEWIDLYHQDRPNWKQNLAHQLHKISKRLQLNTLITAHLTNIKELIIIPHLNLHQIPFAALPIKGTEELLGDRFIIRSIPSCQFLQYCNNRPPITTIVVGTVEDADDTLLGARYEGARIAALYKIPPTNRLIGSTQATATNYHALLTRVNRLHSSHHAIADPHKPLKSALILAHGEMITLGDLLTTRYPNLDEVFLSACETHVGNTTIIDDIATLTTGFLCIGARSVQSTLWSVDDLATVIFNLFYHQQRKIGVTPAIAIQTAQRQLRDLTGKQFKSDYYPTIVKYIDDEIDDLKLTIQQSTLDRNTQTEKWQELTNNINNLTNKIKSLQGISSKSKGYCRDTRPFKDPFYWAGFITQGMG